MQARASEQLKQGCQFRSRLAGLRRRPGYMAIIRHFAREAITARVVSRCETKVIIVIDNSDAAGALWCCRL